MQYSPTQHLLHSPTHSNPMRWFWLDRFTEFVSGSHATAVKCVSLSEDHLHEHWPGYPVMPNTLVAEGMAQCGGLLVSELYKFSELVVLAKFAKCTFDGEVRPGDTLRYRTRRSSKPRTSARRSPSTAHVGDRPLCRGRDFLRPLLDADSTEQTKGRAAVRPGRPAALAARWSACSTSASAPTARACAPKTTISN